MGVQWCYCDVRLEFIRAYALEAVFMSQYSEQSLIPSALRRARLQKGLTLTGLAARTGMAHQHISLVETGSAGVHLATIEKMAKELGLSLVLVPRSLEADVRAYIRTKGRIFVRNPHVQDTEIT